MVERLFRFIIEKLSKHIHNPRKHAKERELLRLDRSERVRYERVNEASSLSAQKSSAGGLGDVVPHLKSERGNVL